MLQNDSNFFNVSNPSIQSLSHSQKRQYIDWMKENFEEKEQNPYLFQKIPN